MQRPIAWVALIALPALGCKCNSAPEEQASPRSSSGQSPSAATAPLAGEPMPPICADLCKRATALECGTVESCGEGCRRMLALPVCQTEVQAFLNCAAGQPDAHWECDPGGPTPSLKESHCGEQRIALAGCLEKGS